MPRLSAAAVRRRPGMFVGDTEDGSAQLHMLLELLANTIDLHLAGRLDRVQIQLRIDGSICVQDYGPGFPSHDCGEINFIERALTCHRDEPTLDGHRPHEHLTSLGVGLFPVCALASAMRVESFCGGRSVRQDFARGVATSALVELGACERSGTVLSFTPDPEIFGESAIETGKVLERLRELAMLLPKIKFEFQDQRLYKIHQPQGVRALLPDASTAHPELSVIQSHEQIEVEVHARFSEFGGTTIHSFANVIKTTGGSHHRGFLLGLAAGLRRRHPAALRGVRSERICRAFNVGVNAVIRVRLQDPKWAGPTRERLNSPVVSHVVKKVTSEAFARLLGAHRELAEQLLAVILARRN